VAGWKVPPKKRPFRGSKRLIIIESQYYYDPFGRRLWKEVNGVRTYFVYADEGVVAEVDAAGNVIKSYGYEPGSTWTTDPLFMKVGGNYYFYQNDHLGTPQKLTVVNGAVVWSAKYSSFGEANVYISSTVTNNLRFSGQYFDQETGLHYNWHRYFDSEIGRYLRVDPIGIAGGINLFSYVSNSPINLIDPDGQIPQALVPLVEAIPLLLGAIWYAINGEPFDINLPEGPLTYNEEEGEDIAEEILDDIAADDCPPDNDDRCKERQKELIQRSITLIDIVDATQRYGPDRDTFIDINIAIAAHNDEVKNHNRVCPNHRVLPVPPVGGRWME